VSFSCCQRPNFTHTHKTTDEVAEEKSKVFSRKPEDPRHYSCCALRPILTVTKVHVFTYFPIPLCEYINRTQIFCQRASHYTGQPSYFVFWRVRLGTSNGLPAELISYHGCTPSLHAAAVTRLSVSRQLCALLVRATDRVVRGNIFVWANINCLSYIICVQVIYQTVDWNY
jgi:hypothetical protein